MVTAAILTLLTSTSSMSVQPKTFQVTPTVEWRRPGQTWEGWGTSLAWFAHIVGGYPAKPREDIMKWIFGYLKLNIVRYNIGGGENPDHHHMEPRALVPGYLGVDGKYDWSADANQRWVLKRAIAMGADRFEAFSNSPPYFMTLDGCASGGPNGIDNFDLSKTKAFAKYLVDVVEHFHQKWGVDFNTVEPLNEPSGGWPEGGRQEGCHVSAGPTQSAIIEAVAAELAKRNLKTKIASPDDVSIANTLHAVKSLSPSALQAISRINSHSYGGGNRAGLNKFAQENGKGLWLSEYGDGDVTGIQMSKRIIEDVGQLKPTAWVYWQAADLPGSGWGFLGCDVNSGAQTFTVNKKLYVMANFSRFIRPGAHFVPVGDPLCLAAVDGDSLVIVATAEQARTLNLSLDGFPAGKVEAYQTSPTEDLAKVSSYKVSEEGLSSDLPASSVTTFVISRK